MSASASSSKCTAADARFSRACESEEVPGMSNTFGDCCSSQASATLCRRDTETRGAGQDGRRGQHRVLDGEG